MHLLLVALTVASPWAPEDLVLAGERGLSDATITSMAASVGTDPATTIYLIRRGVPTDRLAAWGFAVTADDLATAEHLGPAGPPAPVVTDPVAQARALSTVDRTLADEAGPFVLNPLRERHLRRARLSIAAGAAFTALGGFAVAYGVHGMGTLYGTELDCSGSPMLDYGCDPVLAPAGNAPDVVALGVGGLGLLGAGLSFEVGARQLRLAGQYAEGWPEVVAAR